MVQKTWHRPVATPDSRTAAATSRVISWLPRPRWRCSGCAGTRAAIRKFAAYSRTGSRRERVTTATTARHGAPAGLGAARRRPSIAERVGRIGIRSIQDVLFHLPLRYQDRTRVVPIGGLRAGDQAVIEGEIDHAD